jgi:hypothetical protein
MLDKIENIIFPMLSHALSIQGIESLEDAADCTTVLIYHKGTQSQHISQ